MTTNKEELHDELGNNHIATSAETPLRADAFAISDEKRLN